MRIDRSVEVPTIWSGCLSGWYGVRGMGYGRKNRHGTDYLGVGE